MQLIDSLRQGDLLNRSLLKFKRFIGKFTFLCDVYFRYGYSLFLLECREIKARDESDYVKLKQILFQKIKKLHSCQKSFVFKLFKNQKVNLQDQSGVLIKNTNLIECLKIEASEKYELRIVYDYFRYYGDFVVSYLLRMKLLELSVTPEKINKMEMINSLNALLELGRFNEVSSLIENYFDNFIHFDEYFSYQSLVMKPSIDIKKYYEGTLSREDEDFYRYINGKSVAVVGPSPVEQINGDDIDGFDIVIRTNFRLGSNEPIRSYGARTHVSYYNHFRISSRFEEVKRASLSLVWIVVKGKQDLKKVKEEFTNADLRVRKSFLSHPNFFYDSAPMAVQTVLGDLLKFSPSRIKLFSTSFYYSQENYNDSYKATSVSNATVSRSLRIHESFSCIAFVRNLYINNAIEVCQTTKEVLDLPPLEYAKSLQLKYGDYEVF